jgi:hypothetical protein
MADGDCVDNKEAVGSSVACIMTAAGSSRLHARPPTDHFERQLEEACPNQAYPVKHKIRDCGMIKNFMALGSLN